MKIAVPVTDDSFCSHFGGATAFVFYTVEEPGNSVIGREILVPPEHGRGVFPMWLKKNGATLVLAGGMGPRAINIFSHHEIDLMLGVEGDHPDEIVRRYLAGTLEATGEACHDHGFHDCGHDHHHGEERCH